MPQIINYTLYDHCYYGEYNSAVYYIRRWNVKFVNGTYHKFIIHIACQQNHLNIVKLLIDRGIRVNWKNNKGNTSLHIACIFGRLKVAKYLIDNGANIHVKNNKGKTPLDIAFEKGHLQIVKYLIENRANMNLQNITKDTLLHNNCKSDSKKVLIYYHSDNNIKNNNDLSPNDIINSFDYIIGFNIKTSNRNNVLTNIKTSIDSIIMKQKSSEDIEPSAPPKYDESEPSAPPKYEDIVTNNPYNKT